MKKLNILWVLLTAAVLLSACGKSKTNSDFASAGANNGADSQVVAEMASTEPVTLAKKAESAIDSNAAPMDAFTYTIRDDGTACILKYNGKDTDVVITSQIDGTPVTEIGQYAFEAATAVEQVEIPDTVTKIGEFAFQDCENLKHINIPAGVTELPRGTFACCTALTEITIPANVEKADRELFTGCGLVDLHVQNPSLEYENWGLEDMESKCMIYAPAGAAILTWAQNNGFPTTVE
jgi:hypothetical protein